MSAELLVRDDCILCEKSNLTTLIPRDLLPGRVGVLKCGDCGLVFLESRAGEKALVWQEKAYWDQGEQKEIYFQEDIHKSFAKEFEGRLEKLRHYLGGTGTLLDVGCGIGHFLDTARKRGWGVQGLDISKEASRSARETHGLDVAVGTLETVSFPEGGFDAITLWDVIEHIRHPLESLQAANRFLRPGGLLGIKTPDEESLFKQFALAWYRFFRKKGSFLLKYVYYIPHYFSYSRFTLRRLLERSGFEVIAWEQDETPLEFAREKIETHYRKDPKRKIISGLLPFAQFVARLMKRSNKMVVYARKMREAGSDE